MKRIMSLSLALFGLPAHVWAQDSNPEPRALNINVYGIGPAVEPHVVDHVRKVVARRIELGTIDTLLTYGYGVEGGMGICVQLSPWVKAQKILELEKDIKKIRFNPERTFFSAKLELKCAPVEENAD